MREKVVGAVQTGALSRGDRRVQMLGVPVDDDCCEEVQPSHPLVLSLGGMVADFTLATNSQCVLQGVMRLALVQPSLCSVLHFV